MKRLRRYYLLIRTPSLCFRQRYRLIWCVFCRERIPDSLCGSLSLVEHPRKRPRVQRLAWTCLQCWGEARLRTAS